MLSQFILLPLYIYPSSGAWQQLYNAVSAYPNLLFQVVINPASGPGSGSAPDANWIAGISKLNSYSNTQLLGYVHTSTATRPITEVKADIQTYAEWATYKGSDIHMDGIFFDEAPTSYDLLTTGFYMGNASSYVTTALGLGRDYTVYNAGDKSTVLIDVAFYTQADTIIAFENYASAYSDYETLEISSVVRAQTAFLLHDYSGTAAQQTQVVNQIVGNGIPGVFITAQSDYDEWSSLWTNFCSAMNSAVFQSNLGSISVTGKITSTGLAGTKRWVEDSLRRSRIFRSWVE